MRDLTYPAVFFKTSLGYTGTVYDFPSIIGEGPTVRIAADIAEKALIEHIEMLIDDDQSLPVPTWPGDLPDEMGGERGLVMFLKAES